LASRLPCMEDPFRDHTRAQSGNVSGSTALGRARRRAPTSRTSQGDAAKASCLGRDECSTGSLRRTRLSWEPARFGKPSVAGISGCGSRRRRDRMMGLAGSQRRQAARRLHPRSATPSRQGGCDRSASHGRASRSPACRPVLRTCDRLDMDGPGNRLVIGNVGYRAADQLAAARGRRWPGRCRRRLDPPTGVGRRSARWSASIPHRVDRAFSAGSGIVNLSALPETRDSIGAG
jgi:hypothetical protein